MSILSDILRRLAAVRKTVLSIEFRSSLLRAGTLIPAALTLLLAMEMLFRFNSPIRTMFFLASLAMFLGLVTWYVLRPGLRMLGLIRVPSDQALARLVGDRFPPVRDRLLNVLQIEEDRRRGTPYSVELIDASFHDLAEMTAPLDFTHAVDPLPVRRTARHAVAAFLALLALVVSFPHAAPQAAERLLRFNHEFVPPAAFSLVVEPGDKEVIKGEIVPVTVRVLPRASAVIPRNALRIHWRPEGQQSYEVLSAAPSDTAGLFHASFPSVRSSLSYFAEFAGIESGRFKLSVVDRPMIRSLTVRLDFPSYTGLPARIQDDFVGDVTAITGTRVRSTGTASKSLAAGRLRFNNGASAPMTISGTAFSAGFTVRSDSIYALELVDEDDLANADPISYRVTALADEAPRVSIIQPGANVDIAGATTLPLLIDLVDDFGFTRLRLGYRLIHSRYEQPSPSHTFLDVPLPAPAGSRTEIPFDWNFSSLRLVPEDVVEYFAEVFDNDAVTGPKSARSQTYLIRLPSLEEVFTDLDRGHEQTLRELEESAEGAQQLREKIESINEDLKKNREMDWQDQKKLEETAQRYEQLQKKLSEIESELKKMTDQMEQQKVLSPETLEKYLELQQLFEELSSPELQEALKQLQQSMQQINKEQLRKALEQVQLSEENFRRSLERTLDLLKRIQIEQKLDEARKRAEELLDQQESLDSTAATAQTAEQREQLAKKQEDLRKKLENLTAATRDVQNRMEEFFTEMPEEELQAALDRLEQSGASQAMQNAASQLRSGAKSKAEQSAIQDALEQFSMELSKIQMEMLREQQQFIMNELRKATRGLLELSAREEQLKDRSRNAPQNSPQLRQNAQDQMRVSQDLQNLISALQGLSRRSFAVTPEMGRTIGDALMRMQAALQALESRSGGTASQEQQMAMEALNRAAMAVQQSMQDMMQSSGGQGGGLMGQLQQMAGKQMSLNMRTQGLEEAARLALEQEALRKSLEQLNAEAKASNEGQRILGDLERIAREMQEVVRDLEQNDVNPETIRKQERILSRLLDASRSTRERDFEKKRKATAGRTAVRPGPGELTPDQLNGRNKLNEDLLRALEHGYSRDYQDLIRKYFEELQKTDLR